MGPLKIVRMAGNLTEPSGPCARFILEAETECGAFMSAADQLFGKEVASKAVALWVEELEADVKDFSDLDWGWRNVTISAARRLADIMGATHSAAAPAERCVEFLAD